MPLPAALAAKLSKRGIITPKKINDPIKKQDFKGLSTCPNKNNIYHECNYWCETHWKGVITPDARYVRNMQKLLGKYPLPNNWTEVFDKGVGRYYYWNMENDLVSWLPPKHPKAIKSQSAARLRERRILIGEAKKLKELEKEDERNSDSEDRHQSRHSERRERDRDDKRYKKDSRKRIRREDIDPMDPASYSDVAPGTWSDGLENNKTRADSTASGVLFQQRPYPSPGEVLANNNKDKSKK